MVIATTLLTLALSRSQLRRRVCQRMFQAARVRSAIRRSKYLPHINDAITRPPAWIAADRAGARYGQPVGVSIALYPSPLPDFLRKRTVAIRAFRWASPITMQST